MNKKFLEKLKEYKPSLPKKINVNISHENLQNDGSNIEANIDYALLLIEDGETEKAQKLLDDSLPFAPKNPMLHIGKLLIEYHLKNFEELQNATKSFENSKHYERAVRFADEPLKSTLISALENVKNNIINKKYDTALNVYQQAENKEDYLNAKLLFNAILGYKDTDRLLADCLKKIELLTNEEIYQRATNNMSSKLGDTLVNLNNALNDFNSIRGYKDSEEKITACNQLLLSETELLNKRERRIKIGSYSISIIALIAVIGIWFYNSFWVKFFD